MTAKRRASPLDQLRSDAEASIAATPGGEGPARSAESLVHELRVHQIELEMQNESLRQSQRAFEESRDRYVDLYEHAPVGYLTLCQDGEISSVNLTGAKLLGESRERLLFRRFGQFVQEEDLVRWNDRFACAWRRQGPHSCELGLRRRDGSVFSAGLDCLNITSTVALPMLRITITDISPRKAAEAALLDANKRLESLVSEQVVYLSELAGELTLSEQRERDRLHSLLHDEMQPLLIAARLLLSGLNTRTPQSHCLKVAGDACDQISQVIDFARTLGLQLSPPLVRERGLKPALESLFRWVKLNYGLDVALQSGPDAEPWDVAIRLLCFNAVRELLMNVVKHAGTSQVAVSLSLAGDDTLRILVADEGCGYDPVSSTSGSGLSGIARRLAMLGGSLNTESCPGDGTVVTLTVPLRSAGWEHGSFDRRISGKPCEVEDIDC